MTEKQSRGETGRAGKALARLRRGKAQETGAEESETSDAEAKPDELNDVPDIAEKVRFSECAPRSLPSVGSPSARIAVFNYGARRRRPST